MSVRTRVALAYAVIAALVIAGTGLFLAARLGADLRAALDDGLRSRAAIIARDVVEEFGEVGTHEGVIDESESIAQILSPSGAVLETTPSLGRRPLVAGDRLRSIADGGSFETVAPVSGRERALRVLAVRPSGRAVVLVGTELAGLRSAQSSLLRTLLVGGPLLLAATTGAVWFLAAAALRPVERMRAEAEALSFGSGGTEGRRLPVPRTGDEVQRLGVTLNALLVRLEDAMQRERRFVADASHELRTPLASVKAELELALRRERNREELQAAVRSAAEDVDRLAALTERLLILARADGGVLPVRREPTDVSALAAQVAAGLEVRARQAGVELAVAPPGALADVDPLLVRQVLSNLLDNAIANTPRDGRVSVEVDADASPLRITVRDSGPGFPEDTLERAFEPFARADGARPREGGTGLGLSIVRAIAAAHGGTATASNDAAGGARVEVVLPQASHRRLMGTQ